jgi:catechol 2,3-dioxygenase-like lactoylglutathione lyase family enzyme
MSLGLDHLALPIRDAAGTLAFYNGLLGLPLVEALSGDDWGGKPWLMMIFEFDDGRHIALVARRGDRRALGPEGLDLPHFAFSAPDKRALAAWEKKLAKAKVEVTVETHGAQRSLYFQDPNGIMIEITAPASAPVRRDAPEAHAAVDAWLRQMSRPTTKSARRR